MASISCQHIYKIYPGATAPSVTDFNLEIQDKEFIIFVGPSGCGKSTTLRMIAGLEEISKGEMYIGGRLINDVPPKDRDIAMVFQSYALYPHMTVYKNIAFGLELRKTPKDEIDKRVHEAAKILEIEHLLDRKPKALSGGQRQRVALGRAMVRNPAVFLLDEPLSNLDAKLRTSMRTEIIKLHKKLATTFIYVTHDQTEAMTMGDRIVVMKDGFIQQVDTPQNLYDYPINEFVAGFMGSPQMNFIDAKLGKNGRTITLDGSFSYSDNTNNSNSWSNILATQPDRPAVDPVTGVWDPANYTELRYLRNLAPSSSYSLRGSFTYTEPVAKYAQLSFQYRASYNSQERDKRSYITGDDFSTAGLTPDRSLSNSYESGYLTQSVGPGFRFSKERNTFIANVYYQRSALDGQIVRDDAEKIKHAYNNVTYFMMGQLNINRENSLRLFVSSYTDSPSITDLQSVYDVSDAQNISHGNPNLKPTYSHRVNFHYTNSNVEKGRTFMWMFSMNTTLDYTAQHLVQRPGDITIDGQAYSPNFYSTTENLDGYWQLRTHLSYGLPIGFLKSNFNVMAGVIYTKTPSMLGGTVDAATGMISGGERNDTKNMGYDFRAVLGSNISENVDFTLSWNGTYNEATNSLNADKSKNRYFNHTAQGNLKVVFPLGFTFTASAAYSQYIGFTNDYSEDYLLCNVWLGKKVFRNKRGEVMVGVNDLFNQNRAFSRSTGSGYTQNSTNSVIGRYYMVQFNYNLRRFGKKGSRNIKDYDGVESSSGSRRMGPGGPGGPPPGMFHGPR